MFDIKDLGAADQILGMEVNQDRAAKTLKLTQRKFLRSLLEEHGMLDCRPMETPMLANALKTLPSHEEKLDDKAAEFMRDKNYRRLLGLEMSCQNFAGNCLLQADSGANF
ncbi:Pol polyprotein/retrotransposon [Ceratobasidium sp. AG-Ba]|nr:Pol polyprotein/retrotransposon [Ceratobasidium sp. AG-Ba]